MLTVVLALAALYVALYSALYVASYVALAALHVAARVAAKVTERTASAARRRRDDHRRRSLTTGAGRGNAAQKGKRWRLAEADGCIYWVLVDRWCANRRPSGRQHRWLLTATGRTAITGRGIQAARDRIDAAAAAHQKTVARHAVASFCGRAAEMADTIRTTMLMAIILSAVNHYWRATTTHTTGVDNAGLLTAILLMRGVEPPQAAHNRAVARHAVANLCGRAVKMADTARATLLIAVLLSAVSHYWRTTTTTHTAGVDSAGLLIAILLTRGGVEPNPGPKAQGLGAANSVEAPRLPMQRPASSLGFSRSPAPGRPRAATAAEPPAAAALSATSTAQRLPAIPSPCVYCALPDCVAIAIGQGAFALRPTGCVHRRHEAASLLPSRADRPDAQVAAPVRSSSQRRGRGSTSAAPRHPEGPAAIPPPPRGEPPPRGARSTSKTRVAGSEPERAAVRTEPDGRLRHYEAETPHVPATTMRAAAVRCVEGLKQLFGRGTAATAGPNPPPRMGKRESLAAPATGSDATDAGAGAAHSGTTEVAALVLQVADSSTVTFSDAGNGAAQPLPREPRLSGPAAGRDGAAMDGADDDDHGLRSELDVNGRGDHLCCPFSRCATLYFKTDKCSKMRAHLNAEHRRELDDVGVDAINALLKPKHLALCDRCREVVCVKGPRHQCTSARTQGQLRAPLATGQHFVHPDCMTRKQKTQRHLPYSRHKDWVAACRPAIGKYMTEVGTANELQALADIVDLPLKNLAVMTPDKVRTSSSPKKGGRHLLYSSLGRSGGGLTEVCGSAGVAPIDPRVRRAEELFVSGCPKRAVQILTRPRTNTVLDDALKAALDKLHPAPEQVAPRPPSQPSFVVTPDTVRDAVVRRMARGSAPSTDGWTRELLMPLVYDKLCLDGLTLLVSCMLSGRYNDDKSAREMLVLSELLAFPKPNDGIRPISIQSAVVRLAEHVGLLLIDPAVLDKEVLHSSQFGVGKGTERAFHVVRRWLHEPESDGIGLLLIDFSNAFNEASRAEALKAAYANVKLKPLWGILDLTLGTPVPTNMYAKDGSIFHTVISRQGVRQGSVLGPLVFSLQLNAGLKRLQQQGFAAVAYLDDVTVLVTQQAVERAGGVDKLIEKIAACFDGTQLRLNASKTVFLRRPDWQPPASAPKLCKMVDGATRLLGGPIYFPSREGETAAAAYVTRAAEETKAMFSIAEQFANPLIQLAVARLSLEPRIGFLLRVTPPELCTDGVRIFDSNLKSFAMRCLGASAMHNDLVDNSWDLCQLPEGLNLRTARTTADSGAFASSSDDKSYSGAAAKSIGDDRRERLVARLSDDERATVTANAAPLAALWRRPEPWRTPIGVDELPAPAVTRAVLRMALLTPDDSHGTLCKCGEQIHISADRHALACHHANRNPPHAALQEEVRKFLKERGLNPTMVERQIGAGMSERADVEVRVEGPGGGKNFLLELNVPSPTAKAWRQATAAGSVANRACIKKEAEYQYAQQTMGYVAVGIVVDTHGGVADRTIAFVSHVLQQTSARHEQGPRLEAAIIRFQLAVMRGLFEVFELSRRDLSMRSATPATLLPRVGATTMDAARREFAASNVS